MSDASAPGADFGPINPNSEHQLWSQWVFGVEASTKRPRVRECVENARRYFRLLFGTMGRVRCDAQGSYYVFVVQIEGPCAPDPAYVEHVKRDFCARFLAPGFGQGARLVRFDARLTAGDAGDGAPRAQLLVMPSLLSLLSPAGDPERPHGERTL